MTKRTSFLNAVYRIILPLILVLLCCCTKRSSFEDAQYAVAHENGILANEGFRRCHRFVEGWLKHADAKTGLIPKGLKEDRRDFWNPQDAGADNYPFMVLTAAITDRPPRLLLNSRTATKSAPPSKAMANPRTT